MNKPTNTSQDLLNEALREASGDAAQPRATSHASAATSHKLSIEEALQDQHSATPSPSVARTQIPECDSVSASQARKAPLRRLFGFGALVIALIAAGSFWWSQQQKQPTGAAAVLHELNNAVEQHKSKHSGQLPTSLGTLAAFPKGAVEWPFRYWNARDAAGRTEIIWVPRGKNYSIVLRQGNESWIVSDRDPMPKLITTGKR